MAAVENNQLHFVEWLLIKGANINAPMSTGWTAMHAAAKNNHHDILDLLLEGGGNKDLLAKHKEFGSGLKVTDVTSDPKTIRMLQQ